MSTEQLYEALLRELRALGERVSGDVRLLTPEEAASALSISPTQLSRYKALGLVRVTPMGSHWRVSSAEIARIVAEGLPPLNAPAPLRSKTGAAGAAAVRAALRKR